MSFMDQLRCRATVRPRRIIFTEHNDPRTLIAAKTLCEQSLATPVFLNSPAQAIQGCEVFSELAEKTQWYDKARNALKDIQVAQGKSTEAFEEALDSPLTLASLLLRIGYADAGVAGAVFTTAEVLRAGINYVGLAQDKKLVSSVFLMELPGRVLTYADCAVNPEPNAEQLAQIAVNSAMIHQQLNGEPARVALLSFSTKGSAEHKSLERVRAALSIAKKDFPSMTIDGEMQFDAAIIADIGERKAPGSPVAGQANVLIFPDLNAANIGYKITERIGGANAIGPIIQGLAKPWMDLSRGCKPENIVDVAVIASLLAL
jgi:phosphate acetyltransferase